jgi:alkylhydroperoxidase/carboxymuconolactone decarboxylase family protein YurZ
MWPVPPAATIEVVSYTDQLRLLALNDAEFAATSAGSFAHAVRVVDPKTAALTRLAALFAAGGAVPSYGELADAALEAGATPAEIVDVLICVIPVIGLPRAVAEAPKLALALGYDTEDALEQQSAP